jgi:hypothetical protein
MFKFFDTEEQVKSFCDYENLNRYIKKHHPAHYTPWSSSDGKEIKFIAWYAVK